MHSEFDNSNDQINIDHSQNPKNDNRKKSNKISTLKKVQYKNQSLLHELSKRNHNIKSENKKPN